MFAGEQYDPALGLYYNRARYLNASTGRFWSMDSYEGNSNDPVSLHKYLYSHDNPANRSDPSGNADIAELAIVVTVGLDGCLEALGAVGHRERGVEAGAAEALMEAGLPRARMSVKERA